MRRSLGVSFVVEAPRRPYPADPEFDPAPAPTVRLRDFDPLEHQRLVINPFLAVLGLIVLSQAAIWLYHTSIPPLSVVAIVPMALTPFLVQYHCLDCGRTGPYWLRQCHGCPSVVARWHRGRRPIIPFPSSKLQLVIWCWLILSAALLLAIQDWK